LQGEIIEQLRTIYDPEIPVNIYELGLIYDVDVTSHGAVDVKMTLTSAGLPGRRHVAAEVQESRQRARRDGGKGGGCLGSDWNMDMMSDEAKLELGLFDLILPKSRNQRFGFNGGDEVDRRRVQHERYCYGTGDRRRDADAGGGQAGEVSDAEAKQAGRGVARGRQGGGCSGLSYTMTLDTNVTERDQVYEVTASG